MIGGGSFALRCGRSGALALAVPDPPEDGAFRVRASEFAWCRALGCGPVRKWISGTESRCRLVGRLGLGTSFAGVVDISRAICCMSCGAAVCSRLGFLLWSRVGMTTSLNRDDGCLFTELRVLLEPLAGGTPSAVAWASVVKSW